MDTSTLSNESMVISVGDFLISNGVKYFSGTILEIKENSVIMNISGLPPQEVPKEDLFEFTNLGEY
jgi:hypothetical protein